MSHKGQLLYGEVKVGTGQRVAMLAICGDEEYHAAMSANYHHTRPLYCTVLKIVHVCVCVGIVDGSLRLVLYSILS